MRLDRCCSLKFRSCRLRSRSDSSSDMGKEEGSLLLLVPLLLVVLMDCIVVDVTGGAVMGIEKASRCVKADGPNTADGFFGGGGKSEAGGIEAEAPGCFKGLCGGGGKLLPAPPPAAVIVVCGAAADLDDVEDATDGSMETTCGVPSVLLYAELTSSLSSNRSSDAVN